MEEQEKYLTTDQLMYFLEISRSTVRLMAKGMPNMMVGSVHRFPREQVIGQLSPHIEQSKLQEPNCKHILNKVLFCCHGLLTLRAT